VARYCARSFDLPVTIARMGAAYSDQSGLPVWHLDAIAAGEPVHTRWDPMPYSPIHDDDICAQLEPLLDTASVPATIVNWCGDEPVSVQQYSAFFGELLGVEADVAVEEIPGASCGSVGDHTKRSSITGPCRVGWREGFRRVAEHFYPDRIVGA
jgi:nucleoside-diphosphate-sugar epimerase